jgi:endonuclease/exonuclease/phosphatase family metal-dependent hydrolase
MPVAPKRRFARTEEREGPLPSDTPPPKLAEQIEALETALDEQLPKKQLDRNLLIATWNIREFGKVNPKWVAKDGEKPERDVFSIRAIAETISRFDVVAVQEVQENIDALRMLMRTLGSNWGVILTDAVKGDRGDGERLAFVYDTRRAIPSGLACELVVPDEVLKAGAGEDVLKQQFAKTPYAVAFRSESTTFILVTLHVRYGKTKERIPELKAIAKWMRDWAEDTSDNLNQNLIALGDFNINRKDDALYQAFTSEGLSPPDEFDDKNRTLPTTDGKPKYYDQIAWFTEDGDAKLTLGYEGRAGNFEWDQYVFPDMDRDEVSFRISDHYPLWCEFLLPQGI